MKDNSLKIIGQEIDLKLHSALLVRGAIQECYLDLISERRFQDVVVMEGRPGLEAMKTICRQLISKNITPTVIADNMAGFLFYKGFVKEVWLSYQIADKHGALCDIGSLILAVLAKTHKIPVVLYPSEKKVGFIARPKEILKFNGTAVTRSRIKGYVPLMEWVSGKYISNIYE